MNFNSSNDYPRQTGHKFASDAESYRRDLCIRMAHAIVSACGKRPTI